MINGSKLEHRERHPVVAKALHRSGLLLDQDPSYLPHQQASINPKKEHGQHFAPSTPIEQNTDNTVTGGQRMYSHLNVKLH